MADKRGRDRSAEKRAYYLRNKERFAEKRKRQWAKIKADPEAHEKLNAERREQYIAGTGSMYKPKGTRKVHPVKTRVRTREDVSARVRAEMLEARRKWFEKF